MVFLFRCLLGADVGQALVFGFKRTLQLALFPCSRISPRLPNLLVRNARPRRFLAIAFGGVEPVLCDISEQGAQAQLAA